MFSSLRANRSDVGLLKSFRVSVYFGHLVTIWSIEKFSLHASHTMEGSLEMKKECVRCVYPILTRVIITSSLLFRLWGKFHFLMEGFNNIMIIY